jgi:hypothetical protein
VTHFAFPQREYEDCCLLRCDCVQSSRSSLMSRRNVLPLSSRSKSKATSKKQAVNPFTILVTCFVLSSTLKMEAIRSFETSVNYHTWDHFRFDVLTEVPVFPLRCNVLQFGKERRFGGTHRLHPSGQRVTPNFRIGQWSFASLTLRPWRWTLYTFLLSVRRLSNHTT